LSAVRAAGALESGRRLSRHPQCRPRGLGSSPGESRANAGDATRRAMPPLVACLRSSFPRSGASKQLRSLRCRAGSIRGERPAWATRPGSHLRSWTAVCSRSTSRRRRSRVRGGGCRPSWSVAPATSNSPAVAAPTYGPDLPLPPPHVPDPTSWSSSPTDTRHGRPARHLARRSSSRCSAERATSFPLPPSGQPESSADSSDLGNSSRASG